MLRKINYNVGQTSDTGRASMIPDPWESTAPESHFPSPLELDRLLREEHPLLGAIASYPAIGSLEPIVGLLPSPQAAISPTEILLQNELKLSSPWLEPMKAQIEDALALLYWSTTASNLSTI